MTGYLIAHIGHTLKTSEHITWWKPESTGYTFCIDKAGVYSEEEARRICSGSLCLAVPKEAVDPLARSTPYYQRRDGSLKRFYDGGPHRVIPNDRKAWKVLLSARLAGCAIPNKPTPMSSTRARAIYLPQELDA